MNVKWLVGVALALALSVFGISCTQQVPPDQELFHSAENNKVSIIEIFAGASGISETGLSEQGVKDLEILLEKYPESDLAVKAIAQLADYYLNLGDFERAEQRYLELEAKGDDHKYHFNHQGKMGLLKVYWQQGRYDEALRKLEEIRELEPDSVHYELEEYETRLLNAISVKDSETGKVKGKVLIGGKPVEGITIFLRERTPGVQVSPERSYTRRTISGQGGNYSFERVIPGQYDLGVVVELKRISDYYWPVSLGDFWEVEEGESLETDINFVELVEVSGTGSGKVSAPGSGQGADRGPSSVEVLPYEPIEFSWQPYQDAHTYNLKLIGLEQDDNGRFSSSFGVTIVTGINTTEITVDPKEVFLQGIRTDGDGRIAPSSVIGAVAPGGTYAWGVEALDSKGKLLSNSSGYYYSGNYEKLPKFQVSADLAPKGDELLLKGENEEAIRAYLSEVETHPLKPSILRRLSLIYEYGLVGIESNLDQAIKYRKRLVELEGNQVDTRWLAGLYEKADNYIEAEKQLLGWISQGKGEWIDFHHLGEIKMKQGDYDKARDYYYTVLENPESGNHSTLNLVTMLLLLDNKQEALRVAEEYPYAYRASGYLKPLREYVNIDKGNPKLKEALELLLTTREVRGVSSEVEKIYSEMSPGIEKDLLLGLGQGFYSSFGETDK